MDRKSLRNAGYEFAFKEVFGFALPANLVLAWVSSVKKHVHGTNEWVNERTDEGLYFAGREYVGYSMEQFYPIANSFYCEGMISEGQAESIQIKMAKVIGAHKYENAYMELFTDKVYAFLDPREKELMDMPQKVDELYFTTQTLALTLGVSNATAYRKLAKMARLGMCERVKRGVYLVNVGCVDLLREEWRGINKLWNGIPF